MGRLALTLALLVAAAVSADAPLHLEGRSFGPDGALTARAAEVVGGPEPTWTPILVIDAPVLDGPVVRITGTVENRDVVGPAWLVMVVELPNGRFLKIRRSRPGGPVAELRGTAGPRRFEVSGALRGGETAPRRIELALDLQGPGVVTLSDLHFESAPHPPLPFVWTAVHVAQRATLATAILGAGLVAAASWLARRPRGARYARGALAALGVLGIVALAGAASALARQAPQAPWSGLAGVGLLAIVLWLALRGPVARLARNEADG